MGSCHLNHSTKDVLEKLDFQKNNLPEELIKELINFLKSNRTKRHIKRHLSSIKKIRLSKR